MAGNSNSGRHAYSPTDETRQMVRVLKASRMTHAMICEVLDVSHKTLLKHFGDELEIGGAKVQAEVLMARYRAAMAGNVSAQNRMIEAMGLEPPRQPAPERPRKLGKKEQAQRDAEAAPSSADWASLVS